MGESKHINLIKLCVGAETVDDLEAWIIESARRRGNSTDHVHVTRMWPRQEAKLLAGGSLYWVIKGVVQARQHIRGLREQTGADGVRRCAIVLDPRVMRTETALRRPFQGWRYLTPGDAPADLPVGRDPGPTLPPRLEQALAEMGVR